ncbi:hypothetical protein Q3G72_025311 [Acer saccharum]|nr:hypothetical protein Q3G72_025311 [Acer saccharum]
MEKTPNSPHVLIFPAPFQGHVNSMLNLAELLSLSGLTVTFVNSEHNHHLLLQHTGDVQARFAKYPGFQFQTISDGLAPDHPRSVTAMELLEAMSSNSGPLLKQLLVDQTCNRTPVNCIIGDGILGWIIDVADEVKIPVIHFRTISACSFWVYFCIPEIIQAQELPIRENEDMDRLITKVPGMETFLRLRDLPSFCQDVCDRKVVEKMVNDLMVERREEFVKSTDRMAKLAKKSVSDGGSSFCNLDRLIKDIWLMSV